MNMKLEVDERIDTAMGIHGFIKYIGPLDGKEGSWVGILLDNEDGKNDGTHNNIKYFDCDGKKRGVFINFDKLFNKQEGEYKDKYEKLKIYSRARQNVMENKYDERILKYKALLNKRNNEIDKLRKQINENGNYDKLKIKNRILELNKEVEGINMQVKGIRDFVSNNGIISTGKKNLYRDELLKLFDLVQNDNAFIAQYNKFMNM